MGACRWAKPETFVVFAAVTAGVVAFARPAARWTVSVQIVVAVVLAGNRTDLLFALGVAHVARWWWRRSRQDLVTGAWFGTGAVLTTAALRVAYHGARYPRGVGLVQLGWNLRPAHFLVPVLLLMPLLVPVAAGRWRRLGTTERSLLVGFAFYVASTFVVGRVDEVRLFFPFAGAVVLVVARMVEPVVSRRAAS
jgi:hypothetical protein